MKNISRMIRKSWIPLLFLNVVFAGIVHCEQKVLKDIAYDDDHKSQLIDVYLASTDKPSPVIVFIHGGGWRSGSKNRVPSFLRNAHAEGWLTVVSVEYRFTNVATHPAQVEDCTRAIQFVRLNAEKWNIDPDRIAVTGGSAGGHLSAYVALQDDMANPEVADPVERQSSRVMFAIPFAGPTDWSLLSSIEHRHTGYRLLIGYEPGTPFTEMAGDLIKDVSPLSFVSSDDPPMLLVHGDKDRTVPLEHSMVLLSSLRAAGVPAELYTVKGAKHGVAGAEGEGAVRADAYIREKFGVPKKPEPQVP